MKTPEELADLIVRRAYTGFADPERSGYPIITGNSRQDRQNWAKYIRQVIIWVLEEELGT